MGCKFSNKEQTEEDQTEIINKLTHQKELATKYEEEPQIRNEADFQIKIKDLIGEKKGNISDHYDFLKILGEGMFFFYFLNSFCNKFHLGSFGQVKLARHKVSGQTRAIKLIKKGNLSQNEEYELRNEIEILRNLV